MALGVAFPQQVPYSAHPPRDLLKNALHAFTSIYPDSLIHPQIPISSQASKSIVASKIAAQEQHVQAGPSQLAAAVQVGSGPPCSPPTATALAADDIAATMQAWEVAVLPNTFRSSDSTLVRLPSRQGSVNFGKEPTEKDKDDLVLLLNLLQRPIRPTRSVRSQAAQAAQEMYNVAEALKPHKTTNSSSRPSFSSSLPSSHNHPGLENFYTPSSSIKPIQILGERLKLKAKPWLHLPVKHEKNPNDPAVLAELRAAANESRERFKEVLADKPPAYLARFLDVTKLSIQFEDTDAAPEAEPFTTIAL
ncbi:uncharacterized protein DFL_001346 [Arthrobotrys flagrans]|uniref:Uncharacterized protein n=1 Tax=Arthrobotrys flagrans TaxID=97331 RepID=A0A437AGY6_ARTFL|nr:hypothetical protein DFL_001346 [Arthrobotrys flagrans]